MFKYPFMNFNKHITILFLNRKKKLFVYYILKSNIKFVTYLYYVEFIYIKMKFNKKYYFEYYL